MLRAGSEAKPKDLANEKEILRCAQNDSFAVILGTLGAPIRLRLGEPSPRRIKEKMVGIAHPTC
jgi:hypothetical protein